MFKTLYLNEALISTTESHFVTLKVLSVFQSLEGTQTAVDV